MSTTQIAPSPFQNARAILSTFAANLSVITANVKGLSQQDSLIQLAPSANCLNWTLGHIIVSRDRALTLVNEAPVWTQERSLPYQSGSKPLNQNEGATLEVILQALNESQTKLTITIEQLKDSDLSKPLRSKTLGQTLTGFAWHETYHAGQTALYRRLAGPDGAI